MMKNTETVQRRDKMIQKHTIIIIIIIIEGKHTEQQLIYIIYIYLTTVCVCVCVCFLMRLLSDRKLSREAETAGGCVCVCVCVCACACVRVHSCSINGHFTNLMCLNWSERRRRRQEVRGHILSPCFLSLLSHLLAGSDQVSQVVLLELFH